MGVGKVATGVKGGSEESTVQDVVGGGKVSKIAVSTISWVRWRQVDLVLVTVEG